MANLKAEDFKPIPGFNVLKWKEENQARIMRETENMTDEEVREYFRKGAERVWNERIRYRQKMKLEGGEKT